MEWRELPLPEPGAGEVRIRTRACGICATDLEMIAGWERTGFPSVPGHEWSGIVDAVGPGGDKQLLGARCVAENVLADGGEVGFEHAGGYAECFITEADRAHRLPDGLSHDVAVLIEPLAVCVRGLKRLRLDDRRLAVVLGDGPIGLLSVLLLRRAGVERIGVAGGRDTRLALARVFGATDTWNYHACGGDLAGAIRDGLRAEPTSIIEASGSDRAMESALELVGREGRILVLGDYAESSARFRWNRLLHREIELIGSNASAGAWSDAVAAAAELSGSLDRMISHRLPAADFARGLEWMRQQRADVTKIVLQWN